MMFQLEKKYPVALCGTYTKLNIALTIFGLFLICSLVSYLINEQGHFLKVTVITVRL